MNIGFFTDSYFPGIDGVTYTIRAWRDRLEDRGHEVYVVYPASSHEPDDERFPCRRCRISSTVSTAFRCTAGSRRFPIWTWSTATGRRRPV